MAGRKWGGLSLVAIIFHLLPLAPLLTGRWAAFAAALLLVLLPYVKNKKLSVTIAQLEDALAQAPNPNLEKELAGLRQARRRWRYLTLPWLQPERD